MVRRGSVSQAAVRRLYRKARGWNRVAKAARGDNRWRAYLQKKRAIERIRELRPEAVRVDELRWEEPDAVVVGVSVSGCGRLHLLLRCEDHAPGGPWDGLPWEVR